VAYVLTDYTEVIYADEKSATRTFGMDQVEERQSKIKLTTCGLFAHVARSAFRGTSTLSSQNTVCQMLHGLIARHFSAC
jgi:hypothetical protein